VRFVWDFPNEIKDKIEGHGGYSVSNIGLHDLGPYFKNDKK
jgi:hypothetical protein